MFPAFHISPAPVDLYLLSISGVGIKVNFSSAQNEKLAVCKSILALILFFNNLNAFIISSIDLI